HDIMERGLNSFRESCHLSTEDRRKRFLEEARETVQKAQTVLSKDQQQRLRQIDLQFKSTRAFEEPEVIEKLQLTAAQREQIRMIEARSFFASFGGPHSCPMDKRDGPPSGFPPHQLPPQEFGPKLPFFKQGLPPKEDRRPAGPEDESKRPSLDP